MPIKFKVRKAEGHEGLYVLKGASVEGKKTKDLTTISRILGESPKEGSRAIREAVGVTLGTNSFGVGQIRNQNVGLEGSANRVQSVGRSTKAAQASRTAQTQSKRGGYFTRNYKP